MVNKKRMVMITTSLAVASLPFMAPTAVHAAPTTMTQQTGWQGMNFIKADGTQAKGEWIEDNGSWFYIKDNGEYASDEWIGNYYFKYWGYMAHDEWLESNGKWYYLKADGQYAWQEWMGNYYFNYWGDMAQNQWIDYNGNWYYAKADGSYAWEEWIGDYYFNYWGDMAKNTWIGNYYVGSDGKWIEGYSGETQTIANVDDEELYDEIMTMIFEMIQAGKSQSEIAAEVDKIDNGMFNLGAQVEQAKEVHFNEKINIERVNQFFVQILNQERQRIGVNPVQYQPQLLPAAKIRTNELFTQYSHTRPNGKAPFTAIGASIRNTYHWKAENIAGGSLFLMLTEDDIDASVARFFFTAWKNSPGHYASMTNAKAQDVALSVYEVEGIVNSALLICGNKD